MEETTIRLNKFLANLGICSRRDVKQFLKEKSVTVNGQRVKVSGERIDPRKDDIKINGNKIRPPKLVYYLLNKPKGFISTTADEFGRKNVISLIPTKERIYPVGRLDKDTTGLLILTNDGEFTNLLTHPKYHIYKVYRLTISGNINPPQLRALRSGVLLNDGITAPAKVRIVKEKNTTSILEITLHEGKNRQIRRMCETVGISLLALQRIRIGTLTLDNLGEGMYRTLTSPEVQNLKKIASAVST